MRRSDPSPPRSKSTTPSLQSKVTKLPQLKIPQRSNSVLGHSKAILATPADPSPGLASQRSSSDGGSPRSGRSSVMSSARKRWISAPSVSNVSRGKTPSIAASNRSAARLDVLRVGDVDPEDRELLSEGDKRARRVVYDALRSGAPEVAPNRRVVPLAIDPVVPRRRVPPEPAIFDLSFCGIRGHTASGILRTLPRAFKLAGRAIAGGASSNVTEAGNDPAAAARRRRMQEQAAREAEAARIQKLCFFGDENAAFVSAINKYQQQTHAAASGNASPRFSGDDVQAEAPTFRTGALRMWGVRADTASEAFIIIRERDTTYVIDKRTMDDSNSSMKRAQFADRLAALDAFFNAEQLSLAECTLDAGQFVYRMDKDSREYINAMVHRGRGSSEDQQSIDAAAAAANLEIYRMDVLRLVGNVLGPRLDVVDLCRAILLLTMPLKSALHAAYIGPWHSLATNPALVGRVLPFQFLTSLDLSECGLKGLVVPSAKTFAAHMVNFQGDAETLGGIANSSATKPTVICGIEIPPPVPMDVLAAHDFYVHLHSIGSNAQRAEADALEKQPDNTPTSPTNKAVAHWSLAPCAPLRFLSTLYFHGNDLKDWKDVLRFAVLARDTLVALTWHGNPAIDAKHREAADVAVQVLPKLNKLNFSAVHRKKKS